MARSALSQAVKDAIRLEKNVAARVNKFIDAQYLRPSHGEIYRKAILEWLERNEKRPVGRPRKHG